MSEPIEVIDLKSLKENIELAKVEGKNVVINDKADYAIAKIKEAEKLIENTIELIKSYVPEVLEELNATNMKGKYCTISLSKPRNMGEYKIEPDKQVDEKFITVKKSYVPNVDAIDAYVEEHQKLPYGIIQPQGKRVVSIRYKEVNDED